MRKLAVLLLVAAFAGTLVLVQSFLAPVGAALRGFVGEVGEMAPAQVGQWAEQAADLAQRELGAVAQYARETFGQRLGPAAAATEADSFDYNCALPGKGYPWLWPAMAMGSDGTLHCMQCWVSYKFGYGPDYHVPVPIGEDWCPVDMKDVYRRLCQVHPQLGGGGLYPLPEAGPYWFTDGGGEDLSHQYYLPPIPQRVIEDALQEAQQQSTRARPSPRRQPEATPVERQHWRVSVRGYEISEMDPYWRLTTRVRGAVRFEYSLQGEFMLHKKEQAWAFEAGSITLAKVELTSLYEPAGTWELKPLHCRGCDRVTGARRLTGEVYGDAVRLSWGLFRPSVDVEARIAVPCQPMPACAAWGERTYTSETFFDRISGELLPLQDGFSQAYTVTSPQGSTWVSFTYTLTRAAQ
jgi:hypothetical protein